jgi:hypothetical protein
VQSFFPGVCPGSRTVSLTGIFYTLASVPHSFTYNQTDDIALSKSAFERYGFLDNLKTKLDHHVHSLETRSTRMWERISADLRQLQEQHSNLKSLSYSQLHGLQKQWEVLQRDLRL